MENKKPEKTFYHTYIGRKRITKVYQEHVENNYINILPAVPATSIGIPGGFL